MDVTEKIWTYSELVAEFPSEQRIELINNRLFMPPSPSPEHQRSSRKLEFKLVEFVEKNQLGEVFYAPLDVILDDRTVVQPDILFISNARLKHLTKRGFEGIPDLVVEIISPSTFYRDSHEKFGLYERVGVLEYWLIEPANQVVEVFRLEGGRYVLHSVVNAEEGEEVRSHLLAGFSVKKSEIFSSH